MNCQEINFLLDTNSTEELGMTRKRAVDQHLESCHTCREAWEAYREVSALIIPETPQWLRSRVMAAVAPTKARAVPRSLILGGVLAVGAAVAAVVAIRVEVDPVIAQHLEEPTPVAVPGSVMKREPAPVFMGEEQDAADVAGRNKPSDRESNRTEYALDPHSIVVIPVPDEGLESRQAALFEQFYDELLRQLRAVSGLNVVHPGLVSPFLTAAKPEEEIAHELGAAHFVVFSTILEPEFTLTYRVIDARTGAATVSGGFHPRSGARWPGDLPADVANLVESIERGTARFAPVQLQTAIADAHANVLNAALPPNERVEALGRLPQTPEARNDAVVAAAVELATIAPALRGSIWRAMHGVDDPYLIQPLLDSLAYDAAEYARRQAASALKTFAAEPRVKAALEQAQSRDESKTVREAAQRALLTEEERDQLALRRLLDETLPAEERLRATWISEGRNMLEVRLTEEAARAVFDIGTSSTDPGIRSSAWAKLGRGRVEDPGFKDVLLDDLANHPNEEVRSMAANALARYTSDPAVRAALERAESDSSFGVRYAVRRALGKIAR